MFVCLFLFLLLVVGFCNKPTIESIDTLVMQLYFLISNKIRVQHSTSTQKSPLFLVAVLFVCLSSSQFLSHALSQHLNHPDNDTLTCSCVISFYYFSLSTIVHFHCCCTCYYCSSCSCSLLFLVVHIYFTNANVVVGQSRFGRSRNLIELSFL